jgi:CMP-N-acetylneuraminic acid synthetase
MRPAHLAGDDTAAITVVLHALEWFEKEYGYLPKQLMWLQPTSPFRSPRILHQALDILINQQADAVVACQEIYRDLTSLFRIDHDFMTALQKDAPYQSARQHIKPLLTPNGALYLCKTGHLLAKASFYPDKTAPLIMNKVTSLDIDTEEDWAIAEAYIKQGLTG